MQDIVFYAVANETLGVVRDYANAKRKPAPVLALGVSVCLRMRLFAEPNNAAPYPIDSFNAVTDWHWSMDDDFDRTTVCKLVADEGGISVHSVTDTINGETMNFTEFVIPISNMNTEELARWIGGGKMRSGLTGELVGYDNAGHAVFVLQIENFTVRNRVAGLADPTALDQEIVTRSVADLMIRTAVSSSAATKQDIIAPGDLIELSGATVNRRRIMQIREAGAMDTVSKMPAGSTVNQTYRIVEPGNAYKLTAVNADLYLATASSFQPGVASMQWGLESHLELFVAGTGRVHTDGNVILADALEPDSVNNCTVRFHNGRAIIGVEDHIAGSVVTVNAATATEGTLKYYLQQTPPEDATYNETQYIAVDASLNGQPLDMGGAVTNGEKHVVGNGSAETVLTGEITCTGKTTFTNLAMNGVAILGGTMTLGDVHIPNGATVSVSGGGLAIERVTGNGGVIDLNETNVIISSGTTAAASGCTIVNGSATGGGAFRVNGKLNLTSCTISGCLTSAYGQAVYISRGIVDVNECCVTGNGNGTKADLVARANSILNISGGTIRKVGLYGGSAFVAGNVAIGEIVSETNTSGGPVTISSGASINLTSRIVPGGGIVVLAGGCTVNGQPFEDLEIRGTTITSNGYIYGATVYSNAGDDHNVYYTEDNGSSLSSVIVTGATTFAVPGGLVQISGT